MVDYAIRMSDMFDTDRLWINAYKPLGLVGLSEVQSLEEVATAQRIEICRSRRNYLLMAAGVVLVLSVVAYLAAPR